MEITYEGKTYKVEKFDPENHCFWIIRNGCYFGVSAFIA